MSGWLAVWRALWAIALVAVGVATLAGTSQLEPPMPWAPRLAATSVSLAAMLLLYQLVAELCCYQGEGPGDTH